MSNRDLVDRIGCAFATLFFALQMLVVVQTGHAMPFLPILALLATPFALSALTGGQRRCADEPKLVAEGVASR
ncbi:MAG: hypothetical protein ACRDLS_04580 [Solirubrobacteraceae bacterium]